ncbi:MAG: cobyrinate a,c-diamide synthase [Pseudomonadota bacterium]
MPPPPSTHPPAAGGGIARGLVIAAPASGQGKTTVTLGLLRALRRRGVVVASGKSGPDYIDPAFHAVAGGGVCATLDSWAMPPEALLARVPAASLILIEGAMGLLDGAAGQPPGGAGSTAAVAQALNLPVVLVVDAARMGQSIGALVDGFDRACPGGLAGVILNRLGSDRHRAMLVAALSGGPPVLGALPFAADVATPSRHLGLVQAAERADLDAFLDRAADWIAAHLDLDALTELAAPVDRPPARAPLRLVPLGQRIAVAQDVAFSFSYGHLLDDWRAQGAEILPFSPLADQAPDPSADAIYLPGGYPELHLPALTATPFLPGLKAAADRGALIYGECGGYMVLGQAITDADGRAHPMAGLLALETSFAERGRHLGYRRLTGGPAPLAGTLMAHEFHYATTLKAEGSPLFQAKDAEGTVLPPMGLRQGRVMGSFAHVISPG